VTSTDPVDRDPNDSGDDAPGGDAGGSEIALVAIGASAGGISALRSFFEEVPADTGISFVVVMHLSPEHESNLAAVLQPSVQVPVTQVQGKTALAPDHVYVIPPDRALELTDGHLELTAFEEPRGRRAPIDRFFRTVANRHPDGVGVLLSGTGTDGVIGLRAMREQGGLVLAQSPEDAEYDGMPRAAVNAGIVDLVLPARELGWKVVELRGRGARLSTPRSLADLTDVETATLNRVIEELRTRTGHDFSGYKKSTVVRRVARRMHVARAASIGVYLRHLRSTPGEREALLKDLLISVTQFFRDPASFDALAARVVPAVFDGKSDGDTIRVWVPGCATGEEAYSLAMLLAEHADTLDVSERPEIRIFATDLDADAIAIARDGLYPEAIATDMSEARLRRFFVREGSYYRVRRELREVILFSSHDLLRDPPFSRIDLLSSRNLLIYLERDLQRRVFDLFRYALRPGGYLFLGSSEGVDGQGSGFRGVDGRHRIFQRDTTGRPGGGHLPDLPLTAARRRSGAIAAHVRPAEARSDGELHREAVELYAPPSILVDGSHAILHSSDRANRYLQFPAGRPTSNLLKAARPELRLELRSVLYHALETGVPIRSKWVDLSLDGVPRRVQVLAARIESRDGAGCALVTFLESAQPAETEGADERETRDLRYTEDQLDSAEDRIQAMMEQSVIREEELRASNEELQSINEEYKSTLEELETSTEELQSMNEELKTVNDELQSKVEELARSNYDLNNLMASTRIATLFLDRELRIGRFTPALPAIINVVPGDAGRPLAHVTHSLDYDDLLQDCGAVVRNLEPVEREVRSGDGRHFLARITPYETEGDDVGGVVLTFTDITRVREAQDELRRSEERFRVLVETTANIVWTTDPDGTVTQDSPSWREFTGQTVEEWLGAGSFEAVHPEDRDAARAAWLRAVAAEEPFAMEMRIRHAPTDSWRTMSARAVPVRGRGGSVREWVGMATDVTVRKEAQEALIAAKEAVERSDRAKSQFLSMLSHELRTPLTAIVGSTELLETGVVDPVTERHREHLGRIKACAWHLVAIINEILTYTRSEAGKDEVHIQDTDVARITQDVAAMLETEAFAAGLQLRVHGADDPVPARTDAGKVRQIVTNLVGNALKFTRQGAVDIHIAEAENEIQVVVRDTGPGIPDEHLEAIFQPFFQVDSSNTRSVGGTGLGLAVCRRLARALGGDVGVESEPGQGSTFTLRIPRAAPEGPARK
jgi:two-component system, chemotaxis family, CheB/CheR fusion protein